MAPTVGDQQLCCVYTRRNAEAHVKSRARKKNCQHVNPSSSKNLIIPTHYTDSQMSKFLQSRVRSCRQQTHLTTVCREDTALPALLQHLVRRMSMPQWQLAYGAETHALMFRAIACLFVQQS
eukprot:441488-Pelagomonas_calceolata.AAC.1